MGEAAAAAPAGRAATAVVSIDSFQRPADAVDLGTVRRALVIMLRHHGDVLLTSPVYTALRAAAPHIEIDALVYAETLPMLVHNPMLATIHTVDRGWKRLGLVGQVRAEGRLLHGLRARGYELVVHLTEHRRGAWLVRALAPRFAVAPRGREPRRRGPFVWKNAFTHRYVNGSSLPSGAAIGRRHVVDQNLDALRRIGVRVARPPALTMVPGEAGEREATALLARLGIADAFIAMQPTSRWSFKCWSVASNAALIASLLRRGETVLLSCAPDPRERAMLEAIVAAVRTHDAPVERLKVADDGSLNRLAAIVARARIFVGIDSAPMHIAAAMGTPCVALFGPSGEFNWGPWQVAHRVVTHDGYRCRPCGQDGCGGGKVSDCLAHLPVDAVLAAIDDLAREVDGRGDPLAFA